MEQAQKRMGNVYCSCERTAVTWIGTTMQLTYATTRSRLFCLPFSLTLVLSFLLSLLLSLSLSLTLPLFTRMILLFFLASAKVEVDSKFAKHFTHKMYVCACVSYSGELESVVVEMNGPVASLSAQYTHAQHTAV